jgi:hypothetical protein
MNFFDFASNLEKYTTDKFVDDLMESLEKDKEVIEIQESQWDEGKDGDGNLLGLYSKATEILSFGRKKAGTPYNIFETGETRRNLYLFPEKKGDSLLFNFDTKSAAMPDLLQLIGNRLLGLAPKNQDKFTEIAQETAIELLNKNLKL